jgi:hypothetical protein
MQPQSTAPATGWRRRAWIALLVAASAAFSLGFACATPFAAFLPPLRPSPCPARTRYF